MQSSPSFKEIFKIAIPLMIGGMSESISSIVDTAFMGHLGALEMDSMGMVNVFLLLLMMIGWACSRGVQVIISQSFGAKNLHNIGRTVDNAIYFIVPLSLMIGLILFFNSHFLLSLVIQNDEILKMATSIGQIRAFGFPFLFITMILSSFYVGIGKTKIILISQLTAAGVNILFNYMLVFGHGVEAMGYQGSAMATVLSEVVALGIYFISMIMSHKSNVRFNLFQFKKYNSSIINQIIKLALPLVTQYFFSIGSWVLFFSLIEKMGAQALAISIILKQIFTAISIPGFCLATTSNTMVGHLVGRRAIENIIPTIIKIAWISSIILIFFALLTYIFRVPIFELFTKNIELINASHGVLIMLLLAYFFIPSSNVSFNSIIALGNSIFPMIIEISVISIYTIYMVVVIVVLDGTLVMAWTSEIFYWLLLLLICIFYFRFTSWKTHIKFMDDIN